MSSDGSESDSSTNSEGTSVYSVEADDEIVLRSSENERGGGFADELGQELEQDMAVACLDDPVADEEYTRAFLQRQQEYEERKRVLEGRLGRLVAIQEW